MYSHALRFVVIVDEKICLLEIFGEVLRDFVDVFPDVRVKIARRPKFRRARDVVPSEFPIIIYRMFL